jgi:thioesterase DpgC
MDNIVHDKLNEWKKAAPLPQRHNFAKDIDLLKRWHADGKIYLKSLPPPTKRNDEQRRAANYYRDTLAETRGKFVAKHGMEIYANLTNNLTELVRIDELLYRTSERYPDLAPSKVEIQDDMTLELRDKEGHELSQGLILAELLAIPKVGRHLMAAMRQPRADSLHYLNEFQKTGVLELRNIKLIRKNKIGYLILSNHKYLNAEDDELNASMESAVDLILLDPNIEIGVIRGDLMSHAKYRGRRVFCSGVNLTKLYAGKLSYLFYISRELGTLSKIYRGLSHDDTTWNETPDHGHEKPWISAVDCHAIGGGCQLILVSDYVIAESSAYFTIPAKAEGFIPGLANLRLPRRVGQRLAYQMIYRNHKVKANSEDGHKLADEVIEPNAMDDTINRIVKEFCETGIRGTISNRKAFRHGAEPLNVFRKYMATFCQEQARCMFNSEIIHNLKNFWINRSTNLIKSNKHKVSYAKI